MLDKLITFFSLRTFSPGVDVSGLPPLSPDAATQIPPTLPPKKLKPKRVSAPSYLGTAKPGDSLTETDLKTANTDLVNIRNQATTKATINVLAKTDPNMSSAVSNAIKLVVTGGETIIARDMDGLLNVEATSLGQQLLRSMTYSSDYSVGYSPNLDIRGVSEALIRELQVYGSMSCELVLNKARLPFAIRPVSTSQIIWSSRTDGTLYPVQKVGQDEISLDIPTFFYTSVDQDILTAYSSSPLESAIQPMLASLEFLNDLRRVFKAAIQPRTKIEINSEKWLATLPPDVANDREKLKAAMDSTIEGIQGHINGLAPEDAMIVFDTVDAAYMSRQNVSLSDEWKQFSAVLNAGLSAGLKAPGVALGMSAVSSNVASTEALLYSKFLESLQKKLNTLYSRVFTLALRLYGYEVSVEFAYKTFDLRPELELEAFSAMKQSRILEQLSIGMLTDEEANIILTGTLPPTGAPKLSGTFFKAGSTDIASNPTSNTGSAMDKTLDSDTPEEAKTA